MVKKSNVSPGQYTIVTLLSATTYGTIVRYRYGTGTTKNKVKDQTDYKNKGFYAFLINKREDTRCPSFRKDRKHIFSFSTYLDLRWIEY